MDGRGEKQGLTGGSAHAAFANLQSSLITCALVVVLDSRAQVCQWLTTLFFFKQGCSSAIRRKPDLIPLHARD